MVDRRGDPLDKVADAELHFQGGPLEGMELIGFAVRERGSGAGRDGPRRDHASAADTLTTRPYAPSCAESAARELRERPLSDSVGAPLRAQTQERLRKIR